MLFDSKNPKKSDRSRLQKIKPIRRNCKLSLVDAKYRENKEWSPREFENQNIIDQRIKKMIFG